MADVKALFFDFGGVLLQHMDGIDHKAIESRLGLPEKTLYNCLYRESRYLELHVGGCTHDEWIDSVRAAASRRVRRIISRRRTGCGRTESSFSSASAALES